MRRKREKENQNKDNRLNCMFSYGRRGLSDSLDRGGNDWIRQYDDVGKHWMLASHANAKFQSQKRVRLESMQCQRQKHDQCAVAG